MRQTFEAANGVIAQSSSHGLDTVAVEDAPAAPGGTVRKTIALLAQAPMMRG
jgi:hypothetical protein